MGISMINSRPQSELNSSEFESLLPLDELIFEGLFQNLAVLFEIPKGSLHLAQTNEQIGSFLRKKQTSNSALEYPFLFLKIASYSKGSIGSGFAYGRSLTRHGLYLNVNDNQTFVRRVKIIPVVMEYEINFICEDLKASLEFQRKWFAIGDRALMNFTITYYGASIDIKVEMGDSFDTPDMDGSIETLNNYQSLSGLRVYGYINDTTPGGDDKVALINKAKTGVQTGSENSSNALSPDIGYFL